MLKEYLNEEYVDTITELINRMFQYLYLYYYPEKFTFTYKDLPMPMNLDCFHILANRPQLEKRRTKNFGQIATILHKCALLLPTTQKW